MYVYADQLLGRVMAAMDRNTTLLVLSDHGFELGKLQDDPSKTRDMRRVSEPFHRTEGILYLYGHRVKPRARLNRPTILDIAPTVLALNGLGRAADMPGRVLAEALDLTIPAPVASYEPAGAQSADATAPAAGTSDSQVDPEILKKLQSLGYIGATSATGDRNLAAVAFEAGRYEEAAEEYAQLVAEKPDDGSLRASLAGALGALGRYDAALAELTKAIELEPLNVEAYHNRAVIHERREEKAKAVADYQTAVKLQPAVRAVPPGPPAPRRADAAGAARGRREASGRARRGGRRSRAPRRLCRGRAQARRGFEGRARAAALYQYRANVAYLSGDTPGAIAALEQGLEVEPDNALFAENLKRLRQTRPRTAESPRAGARTSRDPSEAWRSIGVAALPFAVYAVGRLPHHLRRRQRRAGDRRRRPGHPAPLGLSALRPARKLWTAVFFFLPLPWSVSLFSRGVRGGGRRALLYRAARQSGAGGFAAAGAACFSPSVRASGPRPTSSASTRSTRSSSPWPLLFALRWQRDRRDRDSARRGVRVRPRRLEPPRSWDVAGSRSGSSPSRLTGTILKRWRLVGGCVLAGARRTAAVSLPAAPRARASAPRLGQPGDPGELRQGRPALATSGAAPGSRARRTSCRSWPTTGGASSRSRPGSAPRWRCSAVLAARRRRWPVLLPLLVMLANAVADGAPRLAQRPLHLAPLLHPLLPDALALLAAWGWQTLSERVPPAARGARPPAAARPRRLGLAGQRPQPLPHRRGLLADAALDAAARLAPDRLGRQHPVRPDVPEPGRRTAPRRRSHPRGRRRRAPAAAVVQPRHRPASSRRTIPTGASPSSRRSRSAWPSASGAPAGRWPPPTPGEGPARGRARSARAQGLPDAEPHRELPPHARR